MLFFISNPKYKITPLQSFTDQKMSQQKDVFLSLSHPDKTSIKVAGEGKAVFQFKQLLISVKSQLNKFPAEHKIRPIY